MSGLFLWLGIAALVQVNILFFLLWLWFFTLFRKRKELFRGANISKQEIPPVNWGDAPVSQMGFTGIAIQCPHCDALPPFENQVGYLEEFEKGAGIVSIECHQCGEEYDYRPDEEE